jgi:hypothetical protein
VAQLCPEVGAVRKLFFWLLILAGFSATVPPVRSRVAPRVAPLWDRVAAEVGPALRRGLAPLKSWQAQQEMRVIGRELRQRGLSLHPLPQPREFVRFMDRARYIPRGSKDPWGTAYTLTVTRDSIIIGSYGPDLQRGTEDDLRLAVSRR